MTAPYIGLRPFEFHESHLFYGRGEHIAEMVRTLRKRHLLAVIGSSGSGKSSLVRAGLLPAIHAGFMNGDEVDCDWRRVIVRPGLDPYENLLQALLPQLSPNGQELSQDLVEFRRQTLRGGPRGLIEVVGDSLLPESTRLVVLIDQFEEIFRFLDRDRKNLEDDRQCESAEQRNDAIAFVDLLLTTAAEQDRQLHILLTMRSEYLGECEAFLGLSEAISKAQFLAPRMKRPQIQEIIERPLWALGASIEPIVVTTLLNSLGTGQDQLPRAEHVLLRMWDRAKLRSPVKLTWDDYVAVGRFERALDQHAEESYAELGDGSADGPQSAKQRVAEWLFRSLSELSAQGTLVRRLTNVGEVAALAGVAESTAVEVVSHFMQAGRNFLVATPHPNAGQRLSATTTLDISHESLLRQWERLRGWICEETEAAAELRRLAADAKNWTAGKRGLLRDPELALLRKQRKKMPSRVWPNRYLTPDELKCADDYLTKSQNRKVIYRIIIAVIILVNAAWVGKVTYSEFRRAAASRRTASVQLYAKQLRDLQRIVDEQGSQGSPDNEGDKRLKRGQEAMAEITDHLNHQLPSYMPGWELSYLKYRVSHIKSRSPDNPLNIDNNRWIWAAPFSPDGRQIGSGDINGEIKIWDTTTGKQVLLLPEQDWRVLCMNFSPTGDRVVVGFNGGKLRVWAVADSKLVLDIDADDGNDSREAPPAVNAAVFNRTGDFIATGGADNTVKIWDVKTGQHRKLTASGASKRILSVCFSPDGQRVAGAGKDGVIWIWDVARGGEPVRVLQDIGGAEIRSIAYSPDGMKIVSGGYDGLVRVWDAHSKHAAPVPLLELSGHSSSVWSVAFSPDGRRIASASYDDSVRLWDSEEGEPLLMLKENHGGAFTVAFSSDGRRIACAAGDGNIRVWDAGPDFVSRVK